MHASKITSCHRIPRGACRPACARRSVTMRGLSGTAWQPSDLYSVCVRAAEGPPGSCLPTPHGTSCLSSKTISMHASSHPLINVCVPSCRIQVRAYSHLYVSWLAAVPVLVGSHTYACLCAGYKCEPIHTCTSAALAAVPVLKGAHNCARACVERVF